MLVVFGASGGVGRQVVAQAPTAGRQVRAVCRPDSVLPQWPANVDVARVQDMTDPATIQRVVEGASAVVSALGTRRRNPRNPWSAILGPIDLMPRFAAALAASAPAHLRVVVVSAAGVNDSWPAVSPLVRLGIARSNLRVQYRELGRMEEVLLGALPHAVCVRPTTLTNGPATGRVRVTDKYGLLSRVTRADVASYLLGRCEGGAGEGRTPMITTW
jgi:NAD(P)-dependent dehydrogenase (short-subunit alcohol dehydrogenase family)